MQTLEKHPSKIEDFLDALLAESRKNEPKVAWEEAKQYLKKIGKV